MLACRSAGDGQDPAGPGGLRGGRGPLLFLRGIGVRRALRRRRCVPGPGPVREGQGQGALHRLYRRN
uniref:Uncharacterized protein n=1 Tax=Picea sitchensis TaxID=3332 RepID=A9NTD3_PICSI|nr:unknown [Picea sitchensis]